MTIRRRLAALGCLVGLHLALFVKVLVAGTLFGSDVDLTFLANRAYGFGEIAKGHLPAWNPYQLCGFPFIASLQSAIFYPPNLLFCVLPVQHAFIASALLH